MSISMENFEAIFGVGNNIQDLRYKVLDFAIQGKLTVQVINQESGNFLVDKIKHEKDRQLNSGMIKKQKKIDSIDNNSIPFNIPSNWAWMKIGDILNAFSGVVYSKEDLSIQSDSMVRVLRGGNIGNMISHYKNDDIMLSREFVKSELLLKENSLITPAVTSLEHVGKIALIESNLTDVAAGGFVLILEPYYSDKLLSKYLLYTFNSIYHRENLRKITNKSGQAFYNISREKMMELIIPIPPQEELKRIVEKVDSLLSELSKLESSIQKRDHLIKLLPQSVVDAIGGCKTGDELETQLRFVIDNFETIFQTPESMQDLRKVILQLAIEGKLVQQNVSDGLASELINKIHTERENLFKDGKIKRQKALLQIVIDEIPFDIPISWKWSKLGDVCYKITDGSHNPPKGIDGNGFPMLSAININQSVDFDKPSRIISRQDFDIENDRTQVKRNDVLLTIVGTIGRAVVVETDELFALQRSVAAIKPGISPMYLKNLLLSPFLYSQMCEAAKGTAQVGIYLGKLNNLLVPIPPFAEQLRIVARVELLMEIIDKLETNLKFKADLIEKMAEI